MLLILHGSLQMLPALGRLLGFLLPSQPVVTSPSVTYSLKASGTG